MKGQKIGPRPRSVASDDRPCRESRRSSIRPSSCESLLRVDAISLSPTPSRMAGRRGRVVGLLSEADTLLLIAAIENGFPPSLVVEEPANRLGQATFEILVSAPAELAFELRSIDRVAAIVTGTVGDERNKAAPGARRAR